MGVIEAAEDRYVTALAAAGDDGLLAAFDAAARHGSPSAAEAMAAPEGDRIDAVAGSVADLAADIAADPALASALAADDAVPEAVRDAVAGLGEAYRVGDGEPEDPVEADLARTLEGLGDDELLAAFGNVSEWCGEYPFARPMGLQELLDVYGPVTVVRMALNSYPCDQEGPFVIGPGCDSIVPADREEAVARCREETRRLARRLAADEALARGVMAMEGNPEPFREALERAAAGRHGGHPTPLPLRR